jgi:hypothetical protein
MRILRSLLATSPELTDSNQFRDFMSISGKKHQGTAGCIEQTLMLRIVSLDDQFLYLQDQFLGSSNFSTEAVAGFSAQGTWFSIALSCKTFLKCWTSCNVLNI